MKRTILLTLFAAGLVTAFMIQSCDPLEPSKYTENFYRFATVEYINNKASLLIDCTGERYYFTNFSTLSDMEDFDVRHGDRVIAGMTLTAVGNMTNNKLYLNELTKYPISSLAEFRPSDTVFNYKYQFDAYNLVNQIYPKIWSKGHYINLTPYFEVSSKEKDIQFYLYPIDVNNNTLVMRLYSNIPDTLPAKYAQHAFLCYDISSLRNPVSDSDEQIHRDSIIRKLDLLDTDTIRIQVYEPEIMRDIWRTDDGIKVKKYYNPRSSVSVSIPFDF